LSKSINAFLPKQLLLPRVRRLWRARLKPPHNAADLPASGLHPDFVAPDAVRVVPAHAERVSHAQRGTHFHRRFAGGLG
jgi:hypothetical protein